MKKMRGFLVECDCFCSILRFQEDEDGVYIDHYISSWYAKQNNIIDVLKYKIKMIWYIIQGKDFHLYDIVLNNESGEEFKRGMIDFCNNNFNKELENG